MEKMDLERLHFNIGIIDSGAAWYGRGTGITTAYIEKMMGEFYLGDVSNSYIYVGQSPAAAKDTKWKMVECLNRDGHLIRDMRVEEFTIHAPGHPKFTFMSVSHFNRQPIHGIRGGRVFLDINQLTSYRLDADLHRMLEYYHTRDIDVA